MLENEETNQQSQEEMSQVTNSTPEIEESTNTNEEQVAQVEQETETETERKLQEACNEILSNIRSVNGLTDYIYWNGTDWNFSIKKKVEATMSDFFRQKANEPENQDIKKQLNDYTKKANLLKLISKIKKIGINDLNNRPYLINTLSGYFDLNEGKLVNPIKDAYMVFKVNTTFDPNAKAETLCGFINTFCKEDKELVNYMQCYFGSLLSGYNVDQTAHFFIGKGANGKTVISEIINEILGSFSVISDKKLLLQQGKSSNQELLRLAGKRVAIINEIEDSAKIKLDVYKRVVGSDTLGFEYQKQHIEFVNRAKLIVFANVFPDIRDTSTATWRRTRIIPCEYQCSDEERNKFLIEDLKKELPGILNWMIEGYKLWAEKKQIESQVINKATQKERYRIDIIGQFLNDCCNISPMTMELSGKLYSAYKSWCERNNLIPEASNKFGEELQKRNFEPSRDKYGRGYIGLELLVA